MTDDSVQIFSDEKKNEEPGESGSFCKLYFDLGT